MNTENAQNVIFILYRGNMLIRMEETRIEVGSQVNTSVFLLLHTNIIGFDQQVYDVPRSSLLYIMILNIF